MSHIEKRCIFAWLFLIVAGCATSKPKPMVPAFSAADRDPFGGWVVVEIQEPKTPDIQGELIAVGPDRLFVLTPAGGIEVPKASIHQATVTLYDPRTLLANVGLGMFLSLSNGVYAAATIPLWGLAGGMALREVTIVSELQYPASPWESLTKGARFPQGLPNGIVVSKLRIRETPAVKQ